MISIFFLAMLIASTLSLSKGQCTANVMVSEIDSKGGSGTERMKIAMVEVNSPEKAYVRLKVCPQGLAPPQGMMTLDCNGNGCSGTAGMYKTSIPPRTKFATIY